VEAQETITTMNEKKLIKVTGRGSSHGLLLATSAFITPCQQFSDQC